jgi:hypothetical protein
LKPEDNESFDQQAHANMNMDAIDAALKAVSDVAAAAETPAAAQAKADAAEVNAKSWIGILGDLLTTAKANIVAAINELKTGHDAHLADEDPHPVYIKHSLATDANDFLVSSAAGVFGKKTIAEVKTLLGVDTPSSPIKSIQRGVTGVPTNADVNVTISAVDMGKAMVNFLGASLPVDRVDAYPLIRLVSPTVLRCSKYQTQYNTTVSWEVVEFA